MSSGYRGHMAGEKHLNWIHHSNCPAALYTEYITTHSPLEVEGTDRVVGELWETSISSVQREGAREGGQRLSARMEAR